MQFIVFIKMPFSTRMKILELLFLLAYLTCSLSCYAVAAGKTPHNHHERMKIARTSNNNHNNNRADDEYTSGETYRRQEVIHPLNEDTNSKSAGADDDIEKYGKAIDSTGHLVKSSIAKMVTLQEQKEGAGTMKEVIAKIKEIQDKIFKRTGVGSKDLEAKLKEMTPQGIPEPSKPMKSMAVTGEKKKIIPEDVVDKILQKFQQLRSEAKNIALVDGGETPKARHKSSSEHIERIPDHPESPYASMEPPIENSEFKNRTEHSNEVATMQADGTPEAVVNQPMRADTSNNIQIPIGNSPTESNQVTKNDKATAPGIPLMFVKQGENLIPVFNNQNSATWGQQDVSVTEKGSVQYNASPGLAPPSTMSNVASFMAGNLDAGKSIQPPIIDGAQLASFQNPAVSRCSVPGPECQQQLEIPNIDSNRETMDLLNKLLHSPVFPQLAARLLDEGTPSSTDRTPFNNLPGDARTLNPTTENSSPNIVPMASNSNEMDGMSPASIQFGLKENIATGYSGSPSMLRTPANIGQPDHNEEVQHFLDSLPESNPSAPAQPYPDTPSSDEMANNNNNNNNVNSRMFREHTVNDISDPLDNEMTQFKSKSPDELLEFAKYRSLVSPDSNGPSRNIFPPPPGTDLGNGRSREGREGENTEGFDPSNLLDTLHSSQLKSNLAGAGDPSNYNDLERYHSRENMRDEVEEELGNEKHDVPEPAPDDLLDQLRHWNQDLRKMPVQGASRHHIPLKFGSSDPSFADEIRTPGGGIQSFDVERKDIASEHNSNKALLRRGAPRRRHGDISVLSDDMLQYKHGRLSMDSDDVVNSFQREQSYSRNNINRPRSRHHRRYNNINSVSKFTRTVNPSARWNIERPHVTSTSSGTDSAADVELRINGALITDNTSLRSTIVDGKVHPGKGKTFASKDPVQIELSHGDDKRKIINILTKSRYNITQDFKRTKIPQTKLVHT